MAYGIQFTYFNNNRVGYPTTIRLLFRTKFNEYKKFSQTFPAITQKPFSIMIA